MSVFICNIWSFITFFYFCFCVFNRFVFFQQRATGNEIALKFRTKFQQNFYQLGCFIHRHSGKVLFLGLLVLSTFCVGLKSAKFENNVEKLWVEGKSFLLFSFVLEEKWKWFSMIIFSSNNIFFTKFIVVDCLWSISLMRSVASILVTKNILPSRIYRKKEHHFYFFLRSISVISKKSDKLEFKAIKSNI